MNNNNLTQKEKLDKIKKAFEKGFNLTPTGDLDGLPKRPLGKGWNSKKWSFAEFVEAVKRENAWSAGIITGLQPNGLYLHCIDFDADVDDKNRLALDKILKELTIAIEYTLKQHRQDCLEKDEKGKELVNPECIAKFLEGIEITPSNRLHFWFYTDKELLKIPDAEKLNFFKVKDGKKEPAKYEFKTNTHMTFYEGLAIEPEKEIIPLRDLPVFAVEEVKTFLSKLGFKFAYLTEEEKKIKEIKDITDKEFKKEKKENLELANIKLKIKKTLKIEELLKELSNYFQVEKDNGNILYCLCPFKPERRSSFSVLETDQGQIWADFHGLHEDYEYPEKVKERFEEKGIATGDIFDVYQIFTGATFKQALIDLGQKAGISKEEIEKALTSKKEVEIKINVLERIKNKKNKIKEEIENVKPVKFLLNLPVVLSEEQATINMILADAGKGKSLFNRSIIGSLIDNEEFIFLYFDLEYIAQISKERKFNELLERDNFYLITPEDVEEIKEEANIKTTSLVIHKIVEEFVKAYKDKKVIVFIDSFEDLIEDTSDDKILKRAFQKLLSLKRTTFIIAHHIAKDITKTNAMRFRGSMVIKAKISSMLYITNRTKETDFEELFEIEILKIRAMYKPVKKLSVRLNLQDFKVLDVITETDTEEIFILKQAFFILKKERQLTKTELIKKVSEKAHKHKDKVRAVIERNPNLFETEKGEKRTIYYRLTTNKDNLDKYLAVLGLGDSSLSEVKQELLEILDNMKDEEEINIEVKKDDGSLIVYKKVKSIKNDIYNMPDEIAEQITNILKALSFQEEEGVPF